jgi:hypothetical protein
MNFDAKELVSHPEVGEPVDFCELRLDYFAFFDCRPPIGQ